MTRVTLVFLVLASSCQWILPPPTSCSDGKANGSETDVDCGGSCTGCAVNSLCFTDTDCATGLCTLNHCSERSCFDGTQNGPETDVDCGGECAPCDPGEHCAVAADCRGGICQAGVCPVASCANQILDGDETDVDCGASCAPCADTLQCRRDTDCMNGACEGGHCGLSCQAPLLACNSACVARLVDRSNCGACGVQCSSSEQCVGGACTPICFGGLIPCGGTCIDPESNPQHCGGCGFPCAPGEFCVGQACVIPCGPGYTVCGQQCVSFERDALNCGGCGNVCPPGMACVGGGCQGGCEAPLLPCAGGAICVDPRNDVMNCGDCNQPCPPPNHAMPACSNSTCVLAVCQPGFDDCNGNALDGCEAPLSGDPMNCGVCRHACQLSESCTAGRCCGPLPPGTYQITCNGCEACNGVLQCMCDDAMQIPRPAMIPLEPPCPAGYVNCNGILMCGSC